MDVLATLTSKGQITIPAEVRKALRLHPGDRVVFRVVEGRTVFLREGEDSTVDAPAVEVQKIPGFFDLAGTVPTPPEVKSMDWPAVRAAAWRAAVSIVSFDRGIRSSANLHRIEP